MWATTGRTRKSRTAPLNAFSPTGFAGLPTTQPDPRFGAVLQQQNVANSNYDGMVLSAKHSFSGGFQFQANYTYSHALDEISNNSLSPFGVNVSAQNAAVVLPGGPEEYSQIQLRERRL